MTWEKKDRIWNFRNYYEKEKFKNNLKWNYEYSMNCSRYAQSHGEQLLDDEQSKINIILNENNE